MSDRCGGVAWTGVRICACLVVALAAVPQLAAWTRVATYKQVSQGNSAPRGLVAGRVVDADSRRGLSECAVALAAVGAPGGLNVAPVAASRRVITDGEGNFVFDDLPAGWYVLEATNASYARSDRAGALLRKPVAPFFLSAGTITTNIILELMRRSSVEGTVVDSDGEPLPEIEVRALSRTVVNGHDHFELGGTARTDDRGMYRIARLEPTEYVIEVHSVQVNLPSSVVNLALSGDSAARRGMADAIYIKGQPAGFSPIGWHDLSGQLFRSQPGSPPVRFETTSQRPSVFVTTLYQSSGSRRATLLHLTPGQDAKGVDFHLSPSRGQMVSGRLNSSGAPVSNAVVRLVRSPDDEGADLQAESAVTLSDSTGRFAFVGVAPGQYVLTAHMRSGSTDSGWVIEPIVVAQDDLANIDLAFSAGLRVVGRILFNNKGPTETAARSEVWLERLDGLQATGSESEWGRAPINTKGDFATSAVPPGRYVFRLSTIPGWTIQSVDGSIQSGTLVIDLSTSDRSDVVVNLTDKPNSVSGTVWGTTGAAQPASYVVFLRADGSGSRPSDAIIPGGRVVLAANDGRYSVEGLTVGTYRVYAFERLPRLTPQSIREIELLRSATIAIAGDQKQTLDVALSAVPVR